MRPRAKSLQLRNAIRRLLRLKLRYDEVMDQLHLPRSTFYRHLEAIRSEDREWLLQEAKSDFISHFRSCLETLENQERALMMIREQAEKPGDKIKASEVICEIEIQMMDLRAYGPTVVLADTRIKENNIAEMLRSQLHTSN